MVAPGNVSVPRGLFRTFHRNIVPSDLLKPGVILRLVSLFAIDNAH